ncbi:MAG: PAS domain-containing protein, partial [Thermoanaerobaculia bacterium]|nr:PAS domain-containing protein [Thermoanaerobaculia bacterium]
MTSNSTAVRAPREKRRTSVEGGKSEEKNATTVHSIPRAILAGVDGLTPSDLDRLPFGVIQLDRSGTILRFNEYEANLSNRRAPETIGKNFFEDVAPCTDVRDFHGRFREGIEAGDLHVSFPFIFRFPRKARRVDVTLYYSDETDTV